MKRWTRQREALQKIFFEIGHPLSIQGILALARKEESKIGQATVYRFIKEFVEQGFLKALDIPGESTLYERSDLPHHHFFNCQACKKILGLHGCPENLFQLIPQGCEVVTHELVFYGRCQDCVKENRLKKNDR